MKQEIERVVAVQCKILFDQKVSIDLARPDEQFGDYTTNVALQLAAKLSKKPREIAEQLATSLREKLKKDVENYRVPAGVRNSLPGPFVSEPIEERLDNSPLAGPSDP